MKTIVFVLLLTATALAGCSGGGKGGDDPTEEVITDPGQLEAGKGAITGLLIDDRYRPLANGLVLLQPAGLTATSNDNGEFQFVNLDPGSYTARATLEGHEAAPQKVQVVAGEFVDLNLEARRIVSTGSTIVTTEYSIFVPCATSTPATTVTHGYCFYDLSGDTYRPGIRGLNFTGEQNITWMVTEMKTNQANNFQLVVRHDNGDPFGGEEYGEAATAGTDYAKVIMQYVEPGAKNVTAYDGNSTHWNNTRIMSALLFYLGDGGEELQGAACAVPASPQPVGPFGNQPACLGYFGVGNAFAIKAQIVISLFLGEPAVDVATYQVLHEGE